MAQAPEPLVGRQTEMDLLEGELSAVREGHSRFVLISGEAGIGKTRLLDELIAVAGAEGFLTVRGRGAELDGDRPFGLYADALDAYLASLDEQALHRLEMDRLGALAAVFPSLHQLDKAVEYPATVTERFRAHYAVRDLLERLAARRRLLVVLDDIHWADGASLELTSYLLRNPPQAEVLVAMAFRTRRGGQPVSGAIGALHGLGRVQAIELRPLDKESVKELVVTDESTDVDELLRLSGGNPFYAQQLAKAGLGHSNVKSRGLQVPAAVAVAIEVELAGLSASSRSIAEAAAVAGDPFELDLAVAASGRSEDEVLAGLDLLFSRDLVRETDLPRRFQFRHPIVHQAVYGSCPPSVKVACHRRVVEALSRRDSSAVALATHVEQSARHGDVSAVATLRRAAEEASASAPTSSVRWLNAALRVLPAEASTTERSALLTQLANSQAALGRFSDAHDTLEECLHLDSDDDMNGEVVTVVRVAEMEQLLGRHAESRARLSKTYDRLGHRTSQEGVSLLIALTAASLYLSDQAQMLEWGRLAVEAAAGLGDQALLAAALAAHAMGAAFAGEESLAVEQHDQCARLVDELADETIVARLDALSNLTLAELYLDRHALGSVHGERALRLARAAGQVHLLPTLTPILGMSLAMVGEMRRSAEVLDDAIEAARLIGDAQGLCMNLFNRELAAVMAGDIETALRVGVESVELAGTVDNGVITAFAGAIHSETLLESGSAEAALELLLESVGGEEIPLLAGSWRAHFLEVLTRCDLAVGDHERAVAAATRLRQQAEDHRLGLTELMAHRADAEVAMADGRFGDSVDAARAAVAAADRIGARTHSAMSRALLGRALLGVGDPDEAIKQFDMAADEFESLSAVRYRDQVESELRQLGQTTTHRRSAPGRADTAGLDSLTGRELEVAELVLDRLTNREIAEKLFLSTKTVETHLRNIFNKLNVSSRVEVARALLKTR